MVTLRYHGELSYIYEVNLAKVRNIAVVAGDRDGRAP